LNTSTGSADSWASGTWITDEELDKQVDELLQGLLQEIEK
jgi:hypothetical protein